MRPLFIGVFRELLRAERLPQFVSSQTVALPIFVVIQTGTMRNNILKVFIFLMIGLFGQLTWGQSMKMGSTTSLPILKNSFPDIVKKGSTSYIINSSPNTSNIATDIPKNSINALNNIKTTTPSIYNGISNPKVVVNNWHPINYQVINNYNYTGVSEWTPPQQIKLNTVPINKKNNCSNSVLFSKSCEMWQSNYNQTNNKTAANTSAYNPDNPLQRKKSISDQILNNIIGSFDTIGLSSKINLGPIRLYYSVKIHQSDYQNTPIYINKTYKNIAISFQKQQNYRESINYWGLAFQSTLKKYFFSAKGLTENEKYKYSVDLIDYLENYYSAITNSYYNPIFNNTIDSYYNTAIGNAFIFASISKGIVLNDILENKKNIDTSMFISPIETNIDFSKRKHEVNHYLNEDEVAVEIVKFYDLHTNNNRYVAVIANHNSYNYVPLSVENNIEGEWFNYYQSQIKNKLRDSLSYIRYWKPISDAIGNAKTVYISNDGIYHKLNLNTLRDGKGKYVIEKWNIHILASTRDLIKRQRTETIPQNPTAILVGNPTFSLSFQEMAKKAQEAPTIPKADICTTILREDERGHFTSLKGAEEEINAIEKLLQENGWRTAKYLNADAIEERMKVFPVQSPTVLSIATHGFFYQDNPHNTLSNDKFNNNGMYKSGLYLAGAETSIHAKNKADSIGNNLHLKSEDGIFYAQEASTLDLDNTELVVLSACETGLGTIQNGEGVYGLQRAFRMAGAKNILMSLWKVEDNSTQELITTFFNYWIEKKMPKYEAFRQAQLDMLAKYKTPLYWGGFILMEK